MGLNIDDVLRSNDEMSEAIQRVRELHQDNVLLDLPKCIHCDEPYPCPTIKALDGEQ
jgi:hypothetical protein